MISKKKPQNMPDGYWWKIKHVSMAQNLIKLMIKN